MPNSTRARAGRKRGKVEKPREDFPLFPHKARGYWCKKVRGRTRYFGKVADDPTGQAALNLWLDQKDALLAGREPKAPGDERLEVRGLLNKFLESKTRQVEMGKVIPRVLAEYRLITDSIAAEFGTHTAVEDLRPEDFEKFLAKTAKRLGPTTLSVWVAKVKAVFNYGYKAGIIDRDPRRMFGPEFVGPDRQQIEAAREAKGERMFSPAELHNLLKKAPVNLRAMILLGVNCGYGNHDCAALPFKALDLERGWITFPRPKTGVKRRCPLWPETIAALKEVIANRKEPTDPAHGQYVFIHAEGRPFVADHRTQTLTLKFTRFAQKVGVYREGLSFYALRHTFATVASGSRDQVGVDYVMGHSDPSIGAKYRERIDDERLVAVVNHVHAWLYGKGGGK